MQFVDMARTWLEAANRLQDPFEISQALNLLGALVADPNEGLDACERAVSLAHELGSPSRIAYASIALGTRLSEIDLDRAETVFEEAMEAARRVQNDWIDSYSANQLAVLQTRKGNLNGAARTLINEAERSNMKGDHFATSISVNFLAAVLASLGDETTALLVGTWGVQHGATYDMANPAFTGIMADYNRVLSRQSESDRHALMQKIASLDTTEIISIVRRQVEQLGPES